MSRASRWSSLAAATFGIRGTGLFSTGFNRWGTGLLLLAAVPVFFLALGANSIWDANEAYYVETPRQMVLTGDYINPSFGGAPRFNKPVLSYWIVAGAYRALGESVAVERVVIALGALGILYAAFLMGRALRSPATGALAALLLATSPRIVFFSRRILIDVYLTLFMSLALACFVLAERHPDRRRRYLLLMYGAMGLGMLTKGPVAVVLPALVCAVWLLVEGRLREVGRLRLLPGALMLLAIVVPWYAAVYAQHGWSYISQFFIGENLARYANPITTERSLWFYVPAVFADMLLPWAPLLVIPIWTAWRRRPAPPFESQGSIRRLLWLWIVVIVLVFTFSASKEDLYVLPVIPAAAVLIADLLVATGFGARHRGVAGILAAVGVLCVALGGLVAALLRTGYYALADAPLVAAVLVTCGLMAVLFVQRQRRAEAFGALAAGFILFNYLFVVRVLPDVERLKPVPPLARAFAERAGPDARLAFFNMVLPSLVYYTGQPVTELGGLDAAVQFLRDRPEAWVMTGEREWTDLHDRVPGVCIAARHALFEARGSDILRRRPPVDVLLVTNRCTGTDASDRPGP